LFNAYLSDIPVPPPRIELVSYADDITLFTEGTDITDMSNALTDYLSSLADYLDQKKLSLSPAKSTVTLFTPDGRQHHIHPQVRIRDTLLPLVKTPRILGVKFDPSLTFHPHAKETAGKTKRRNTVLRALAGTKWGTSKETLEVSFKAVGRSILNYGAPVWSPILSSSGFDLMQAAQNASLRTITGCHRNSAIQHLHHETQLLPVREHSHMLATQFLAKMKHPQHPLRSLCDRAAPPRNRKPSLSTHYGEQFDNAKTALPQNERDDFNTKAIVKQIHTQAVDQYISNMQPNRILGQQPPPISIDEQQLPRISRCRLAQMRSGFCVQLADYKHRLDTNHSPICPDCSREDQDVLHVFRCRPTPLTVEDLWRRPIETAHFLGLPPPTDTPPPAET
jgi:hypothetical protein